MGFRHHLAVIEHSSITAVRRANPLGDALFCEAFEAFLGEEILCFPGRCDADLLQQLQAAGEPLFEGESACGMPEDSSPLLLRRDGLMLVISWAETRVIEWADELRRDGNERYMFADHWVAVWGGVAGMRLPSNLDLKNKYRVCTQDSLDMAIFNLVHALKTLDWDKQAIIMHGW